MQHDTSNRDRPRVSILAAMVLVVTLAGCAGTGLGAKLAAPDPYTETGAELNGSDLRGTHLAGLEAAGSFRSTTALDLRSAEGAVHVNRSVAVDLAANRSRGTTQFDSAAVEGDGLVITTYTTRNTTYRRIVADVGDQRITRYDTAQELYRDGLLSVRPVNTTRATNAGIVATVVDDVNWTQRGVERHDGTWVTRYGASGPGNGSGIGRTAVDAGRVEATDGADLPELDVEVTAVNATLLVDPDGVVRRLHVRVVGTAAGQPVEVTLVVATEAVGSTTVERPAWIGEAAD